MRKTLTSCFLFALLVAMLSTGGAHAVGETGAARAVAAPATKVVRYGPFTVPAATAAGPGMIENQLRLFVSKPCIDCHITSFTPQLVYADGSPATMETGAMLHHFVLASQFQRDATCGGTLLGLAGERFFASGDERTAVAFPPDYGYRVRWYDQWHLLTDLMNMSTSAKTVYVQVTFTVRPSWEPVRPVKPVWLDIDQCGDSQYSIPVGFSETTWDWNVNVPGNVVAMLGHVHPHGLYIEATNESEGGVSLCKSAATTAEHHVLSMSTCVGDPIAVVRAGQVVRIHSVYDSPHAADDVMGIMLAYINPTS
jgi:hypothetical protein